MGVGWIIDCCAGCKGRSCSVGSDSSGNGASVHWSQGTSRCSIQGSGQRAARAWPQLQEQPAQSFSSESQQADAYVRRQSGQEPWRSNGKSAQAYAEVSACRLRVVHCSTLRTVSRPCCQLGLQLVLYHGKCGQCYLCEP